MPLKKSELYSSLWQALMRPQSSDYALSSNTRHTYAKGWLRIRRKSKSIELKPLTSTCLADLREADVPMQFHEVIENQKLRPQSGLKTRFVFMRWNSVGTHNLLVNGSLTV